MVSSTVAVYGILQKMPLPKASQHPINSYCKTKLFMKRMLNDFARAHSISWTDLRYFNAASGAPDGETGEPTIPRCIFFPALSWHWTASLPIFTSWMIPYLRRTVPASAIAFTSATSPQPHQSHGASSTAVSGKGLPLTLAQARPLREADL